MRDQDLCRQEPYKHTITLHSKWLVVILVYNTKISENVKIVQCLTKYQSKLLRIKLFCATEYAYCVMRNTNVLYNIFMYIYYNISVKEEQLWSMMTIFIIYNVFKKVKKKIHALTRYMINALSGLIYEIMSW